MVKGVPEPGVGIIGYLESQGQCWDSDWRERGGEGKQPNKFLSVLKRPNPPGGGKKKLSGHGVQRGERDTGVG